MSEIRTNLKEQAKALGFAGQALYKVCGQAIADGIWEEFEQLVYETAQYTGSTAASWNIATRGAGSHGEARVRELGPDEEPLHKGHQVAVGIALRENVNNLDDLRAGSRRALNSGINVWNEAPGAETAEEGPLRPVNDPPGAFARFQARVQEKVFEPIAATTTLEDLVRIAKGGK